MLYSVTLHGEPTSVFQLELGDKGLIQLQRQNLVVFDSEHSWDYLRQALPNRIIARLNPECDLGKEVVWQMDHGGKRHVTVKEAKARELEAIWGDL